MCRSLNAHILMLFSLTWFLCYVLLGAAATTSSYCYCASSAPPLKWVQTWAVAFPRSATWVQISVGLFSVVTLVVHDDDDGEFSSTSSHHMDQALAFQVSAARFECRFAGFFCSLAPWWNLGKPSSFSVEQLRVEGRGSSGNVKLIINKEKPQMSGTTSAQHSSTTIWLAKQNERTGEATQNGWLFG